jgi:uncharacterized protein
VTSPAAPWLTFLASPAAPKSALSPLALDGYLTGVVVAPNLILPSLWIAALWGGEETVFDNDAEIGTVMGTVMAHYNALGTEIDRSLKRLEDERVCDYRPAFLTMGGESARDAVREWIGGFWKAMALVPEGWSAMAEDERTQVLISPFVGFLDLGEDEAFEPAEDIDERLDESIEQIPRAILILHKIAKLRAARTAEIPAPARRTKVGRNDPCPCGSGKKYKHCCGQS